MKIYDFWLYQNHPALAGRLAAQTEVLEASCISHSTEDLAALEIILLICTPLFLNVSIPSKQLQIDQGKAIIFSFVTKSPFVELTIYVEKPGEIRVFRESFFTKSFSSIDLNGIEKYFSEVMESRWKSE